MYFVFWHLLKHVHLDLPANVITFRLIFFCKALYCCVRSSTTLIAVAGGKIAIPFFEKTIGFDIFDQIQVFLSLNVIRYFS
jgi:hypothetical protein